ncbi:hypothetical protein TcCL_Unassigned05759 [Trypanosoma cruzi]|nr:hypothetical protein TcCL_Unassigned05759 [Trypanosoma cruzi]
MCVCVPSCGKCRFANLLRCGEGYVSAHGMKLTDCNRTGCFWWGWREVGGSGGGVVWVVMAFLRTGFLCHVYYFVPATRIWFCTEFSGGLASSDLGGRRKCLKAFGGGGTGEGRARVRRPSLL